MNPWFKRGSYPKPYVCINDDVVKLDVVVSFKKSRELLWICTFATWN